MKIHIRAPKPYDISFFKDKGIWLIRANTPKHLFGIGITFDTPKFIHRNK
jgi:hypothetical protein